VAAEGSLRLGKSAPVRTVRGSAGHGRRPLGDAVSAEYGHTPDPPMNTSIVEHKLRISGLLDCGPRTGCHRGTAHRVDEAEHLPNKTETRHGTRAQSMQEEG
jgi:hypothetical protein